MGWVIRLYILFFSHIKLLSIFEFRIGVDGDDFALPLNEIVSLERGNNSGS